MFHHLVTGGLLSGMVYENRMSDIILLSKNREVRKITQNFEICNKKGKTDAYQAPSGDPLHDFI
jgi:hypothetical protein